MIKCFMMAQEDEDDDDEERNLLVKIILCPFSLPFLPFPIKMNNTFNDHNLWVDIYPN